MARINKHLLLRLKEETGLSQGRIYALIGEKASATLLPRNLAALALAGELKINISKRMYATDDERRQLLHASGVHVSSIPVSKEKETNHANQRKRKSVKAQGRKVTLKSNLVWVVHGRDLSLRDAMYDFLRSLGLSPIEWNRAVKATKKASPYIGEVLNAAFEQAAAVIVMLTPDDQAKLKGKYLTSKDPLYEKRLTGQARPNVLFEAGLAFGSHPDRTVIVEIGDLRPFSDVAGRHVVYLSDAVSARLELISKLEAAGCAVDKEGASWVTAGKFGKSR